MAHTPEIRAKIAELNASGKSAREIAAVLGIGKSTVSTILRSTEGYVPKRAKKVEVAEEIQEPSAEMPISETEADNYLKAIEPPAPLPSVSDKAFLADFARKMKSRKEKEEAPEELEAEEAPAPRAPKVKEAPKPKEVPVVLDKGSLIAKITSLVQTFAPILTAHVKDPARFIESLQSKGVTELKTTLELLETTKTIHNGANGMRHLFTVAAGGVEQLGRMFRLRTEGYQQAIMSREEELKLLFAEIAYENIDSIRKVQSPAARLALLMTTTLLAVDSRNRNSGSVAPSDAPKSDLGEKYTDL